MGFQTLEILRQGVWASVTGGFFYDPHHDLFCNTFHFYMWMFLVLSPFLVHLWSSCTWYPWVAYTGSVLIAFAAIKIINLRLHFMFDTSESIEEQPQDVHRLRHKGNQANSDFEDIELQVLSTKETRSDSVSPTVPDTFFHSVSNRSQQGRTISSVNEAVCELSAAGVTASSDQHCDVKVDVHRKSSSASSEPTILALDAQPEKTTRQSITKSKGHALVGGDDSFTPEAMTSLKSVDTEEAEKTERSCLRPSTGGRRFSNVSNLAFEMSRTTISAPRLQGGGSLELGFVLEDSVQLTNKNISRPSGTGGLASVRRTLSALETSSGSADPSSTASAPQNVGGALSYVICDPITEHQNAEQFHQQRDAERKIDLSTYETGAMVVVGATTPTERSPLLVPNAKTNEELPDWAAFLTSTPMQKQLLRQPASSSASSSTTASQDALHSLNVSRTRQLFALSPMRAHPISSTEISNGRPGQAPLRDLDTPTSNSSSSSTADSTEGEAIRLLPLPPRTLPLPLRSPPTLTTSISTTISSSSLPLPSASGDQGVIPKRRQHSGTCQIEEESEEEENEIAADSTRLQDDVSQFTPPKRRKLAARRRRHPVESSGNSMVAMLEDEAYGSSTGAIGQARNRKPCTNRPRRRRRANAFYTASVPLERKDHDLKRAVEPISVPSTFVLPPSTFPWFSGTGTQTSDISANSGANISTATRITHLSTPGNSATAGEHLSSSSISLSSALTVVVPDSPTVLFQPCPKERRRETERPDCLRSRSSRDRDRRSHGAGSTTSNPAAVETTNVAEYFGSNTMQYLLYNLHTGRSPLQFISATNLGPGSGERHHGHGARHHHHQNPFGLPNMVDSVAEVLGRVNSLPNANNNHNEAVRLRNNGSEPEELQSPPILPLVKSRRYYRFKLWPKCPWSNSPTSGSIKIRFDRLALLALFDRNVSSWDSALCVLLALTVSILTALVLRSGLLQDAYAFLFCLVCAGCQYSMLKSVQPDAASPTHGFNRLVAFSRPVYFIVLVSLLLLADYYATNRIGRSTYLYGVEWGSSEQLLIIRNFLLILILGFPAIFSLGLLPQISTFTVHVLEQVDIHVFGGTAVTGLSSAIFVVLRSCFLVALLFGPAFAGLKEQANSQHIFFSAYCGLLVASCYHVSRCSSDPSTLWGWIIQLATQKDIIGTKEESKPDTKVLPNEEEEDSLPRQMRETIVARLRSDAIVCPLVAILVFGVHCSTVFTSRQLQPILGEVLWMTPSALGFLLHYLIPQLRKQLPWLCFSRPLMRSHEHNQFEVHQPARLMWFERAYLWLTMLERHVLLPVLFLDVMTRDSPVLVTKFGLPAGTILAVVCGTKAVRSCLTDPSSQYLIITFAKLLFGKDLASAGYTETFLVDYFVVSLLISKVAEFLLKIQFIITYIAPWQITWGSAFHAFAQPFSVPHSAMLFAQAAVSSLISAPLSPFLGSAIFFTSYIRPIKFWERDYKTRRVDASNTRLASQLEPMRNPGGDDNNLNSIFYEHLTRSLQQSLAGDLMLGRWGGPISQGDCYVLASENLNCLVHLVELGNGIATFQVRGLEFRGTYCQQREVEAISEGVEEDDTCCCCEPGHLPHMLGGNAAFNQRWLAWQVMATKYVLEGYSISDNNAASMLHVFDLRRILVTYYVKSVIYYVTRSPRLEDWLTNPSIVEALQSMSSDRSFADLDPVFNINIDEDYDYHVPGITRFSFCSVYLSWIKYCAGRREKSVDSGRDSLLVSLCLGLSLLGRRALGSAAHSALSSVEFFLYGLHALFKGDFRITSFRDEWVFNDMELLRRVVAPGVRMSLKLHQDHFTCPDEYDDPSVLYEAISGHEEKLVISHEGDPAWRRAVLSGVPSLLALRHVVDDNSDEYKIIMLNKRFLSFRVIKLNRECVRGLWAGQQQELVYLRNRNQERGSIQNAKQVLRNIINSSCDQPIGYPIYVSPLMTSFAETHPQIRSTLGGPLSIQAIRKAALVFFRRLRTRCGEGCSSGGSGVGGPGGVQCGDVEISLENLRSNLMSTATTTGSLNATTTTTSVGRGYPAFTCSFTGSTSSALGPMGLGTYAALNASSAGMTSFAFNPARGSSPRSSLGTQRGSIASTMSGTLRKPSGSTLISLAGMLAERDSVAAATAAAVTTATSTPMGSGTLNGSAPSVRERRSSRGSESQERDVRLRRQAAESGAGAATRQRNSSGRTGEEERRGARERSRRRDRSRRDRFDRLETADTDRPLYETEAFMDSRISVDQLVKIVDPNQVYDTINLGRRIDVLWPSQTIRNQGGKSYWKSWLPEEGMEGVVVHRWVPNHPDSRQRSHVDRVILLLQIEDKYVPIAESAVEPVSLASTSIGESSVLSEIKVKAKELAD